MNDIFDIRRFGRYFASDLTRTFSQNWIRLVCYGLVPIIIMIIGYLFNIADSGYAHFHMSPISRSGIYLVVALLFTMNAPTMCYGYVTDKRAGSNFCLIPSSTLEKTVSMILCACFVMPLAFLGLYLLSDLLTTLIAAQSAGESLLLNFNNLAIFSYSTTSGAVGNLLDLHLGSVVFLLGAVIFRKGKASKTILVIFGFFIILSILFVLGIGLWIPTGETVWEALELNPEKITVWNNISDVIIILLLYSCIYFRIKKIQY